MYYTVSYCIIMKWQKFTQQLDWFSAKWSWSFALWSAWRMNKLTTNWTWGAGNALHRTSMWQYWSSLVQERETHRKECSDQQTLGFCLTQKMSFLCLYSLKLSNTWFDHLIWHFCIGGEWVICPAHFWKALPPLSGLGHWNGKWYFVEFWIMP